MSEENLEPLSQEEEIILQRLLGEKGRQDYPTPKDKADVISYFKKVIAMNDNSKTANLDIIELGIAKLPVRTVQDLSLYAEKMDMKGFSNYFKAEGQITLATSLSKDGFLDVLAVTQKRETNVKTRRHFNRDSGGLFKKKDKNPEGEF